MASTPKIPPEIAGLVGLGATLAVSVGGGSVLGRWAGIHWGFEPWGTLAGAGLGIASAGWAVYRVVKRLDRLDSKARPSPEKSDLENGRSSKNPIPPNAGQGPGSV
jgi:hypothetical protein